MIRTTILLCIVTTVTSLPYSNKVVDVVPPEYVSEYNDRDNVQYQSREPDMAIQGSYSYYDTQGLRQTVKYVTNGYGLGVKPITDISHGNVADGAEPVIKAIAAEQPKENVAESGKFVAKHWFDYDWFTRYDLSNASKKQGVVVADPAKSIVAEPVKPAIIDVTKLLPVTEPIQKEGFAETVQPGAQPFDHFSYYYFPYYYNPPYSYFVQFRYTSSS